MDAEFHLGERPRGSNAGRREGEPARILVLADLRGMPAAAAPRGNLAERVIASLDVDTFDELMARLAPRVEWPGDVAEFRELEDFHPDRLLPRLASLDALRRIRERLLDPATFAEAAAELSGAPMPTSGTWNSPEPAGGTAAETSSTFERLLGGPAAPAPARAAPAPETAAGALIRRLIEPYVTAAPDPKLPQLLAAVDASMTDALRAALHDPRFQRLESAWRSLHVLCARLELEEDLRLDVLDLGEAELAADLDAAGDAIEQSGLHRLLVERGVEVPGGRHWSLIVGDYRFGRTSRDTERLGQLGTIASRAGAPFIAGADPGGFAWRPAPGTSDTRDTSNPGDPADPGDAWSALRRRPEAGWIGLAWPRVLQRLPYGGRTDPIERFEFEEVSSAERDHERYLWGNPAFACALLAGWSLSSGEDVHEIDDLPAHTYESAGESCMKPCAEIALSEREAQVVMDDGVMPLLSHRNRACVRLLRFQSLADPPAALPLP